MIAMIMAFPNDALKAASPDDGTIGFSKPYIGSLYFSNCGFNVTGFVLDYFNRECDLDRIASLLDLGVNHERACSFELLSRALAAEGCSTAAFKGASLGEVCDRLRHGLLAILQLGSGPGNHFVVLFRAPDGRCGVFDFPRALRYFDSRQSDPFLTRFFTGNVLFASDQSLPSLATELARPPEPNPAPPSQPAPSVPAPQSAASVPSPTPPPTATPASPTTASPANDAVQRGEKIVVASSIVAVLPKVQEVFEVPVPVQNRSDLPLVIKKASGACSCFIGMSDAPRTIAPNSTDTLHLHFRTPLFSRLQGTTVIFETDDAVLPLVRVQIKPNQDPVIQRRPAVTVPIKNIDLGRVASPTFAGLSVQFSILVDPNREIDTGPVSIVAVKYDDRLIAVRHAQAEFSVRGRKWREYRLIAELRALPPGAFDIPISVQTTDTVEQIFTLHLTGELLE